MLSRVERVMGTFWIGGLWVIGYVVAPVLFSMLPKAQAGDVAGRLFAIINVVGLAVGVALAFLAWRRRARREFWVLIAMWVGTAVSVVVLQPILADLKAQGLTMGGEIARQFGMLHGLSSIVYLVVSVLGLSYVIIRREAVK